MSVEQRHYLKQHNIDHNPAPAAKDCAVDISRLYTKLAERYVQPTTLQRVVASADQQADFLPLKPGLQYHRLPKPDDPDTPYHLFTSTPRADQPPFSVQISPAELPGAQDVLITPYAQEDPDALWVVTDQQGKLTSAHRFPTNEAPPTGVRGFLDRHGRDNLSFLLRQLQSADLLLRHFCPVPDWLPEQATCLSNQSLNHYRLLSQLLQDGEAEVVDGNHIVQRHPEDPSVRVIQYKNSNASVIITKDQLTIDLKDDNSRHQPAKQYSFSLAALEQQQPTDADILRQQKQFAALAIYLRRQMGRRELLRIFGVVAGLIATGGTAITLISATCNESGAIPTIDPTLTSDAASPRDESQNPDTAPAKEPLSEADLQALIIDATYDLDLSPQGRDLITLWLASMPVKYALEKISQVVPTDANQFFNQLGIETGTDLRILFPNIRKVNGGIRIVNPQTGEFIKMASLNAEPAVAAANEVSFLQQKQALKLLGLADEAARVKFIRQLTYNGEQYNAVVVPRLAPKTLKSHLLEIRDPQQAAQLLEKYYAEILIPQLRRGVVHRDPNATNIGWRGASDPQPMVNFDYTHTPIGQYDEKTMAKYLYERLQRQARLYETELLPLSEINEKWQLGLTIDESEVIRILTDMPDGSRIEVFVSSDEFAGMDADAKWEQIGNIREEVRQGKSIRTAEGIQLTRTTGTKVPASRWELVERALKRAGQGLEIVGWVALLEQFRTLAAESFTATVVELPFNDNTGVMQLNKLYEEIERGKIMVLNSGEPGTGSTVAEMITLANLGITPKEYNNLAQTMAVNDPRPSMLTFEPSLTEALTFQSPPATTWAADIVFDQFTGTRRIILYGFDPTTRELNMQLILKQDEQQDGEQNWQVDWEVLEKIAKQYGADSQFSLTLNGWKSGTRGIGGFMQSPATPCDIELPRARSAREEKFQQLTINCRK